MSGHSWKLAVVDLVRQQVLAGQTYRFTITTGSMAPFLLPGDEVSIEPIAVADLRFGDIVMVNAGEIFLVHRLVRVEFGDGGVNLLTRGDHNLNRDQPWPATALVGRVTRRIRAGKSRNLREGWGYVASRAVGRLSYVECGLYCAAQPFLRPLVSKWQPGGRIAAWLLRGPFYRLASWLSRA